MATKKAAKKANKKSTKKTGAKKTSRRGRAGYSQAEREKLLAEYDAKRASGMKAQEAAKALGVSYLSLLRWQKDAGGGAAKPAKRGRKPKAAQPQGRQAKAKAKTASRKVRSTRQKARKAAGGAYTLTIEGQGTNIQKEIDEDIMSQIVKMVF
jgi:transposase